jgi:hypothetical protein
MPRSKVSLLSNTTVWLRQVFRKFRFKVFPADPSGTQSTCPDASYTDSDGTEVSDMSENGWEAGESEERNVERCLQR